MNLLKLGRFASNVDFRNSVNSEQILNSDQLHTPLVLKSRTTSMGDPGHAIFKNNKGALAVNDSISSNKTRPSHDRNIGRDQSAVMQA